jgi:uncharacterized protein (TIGR04222 family)
MIESKALDLYDAAYLAGGCDRVVDTALIVLLESGRVRARRTGELRVVELVRGDKVESAVLDAIGTRGSRTVGMVRMRAVKDKRITRIADRLVTDGLLSTRAPAWGLGRGPRRGPGNRPATGRGAAGGGVRAAAPLGPDPAPEAGALLRRRAAQLVRRQVLRPLGLQRLRDRRRIVRLRL